MRQDIKNKTPKGQVKLPFSYFKQKGRRTKNYRLILSSRWIFTLTARNFVLNSENKSKHNNYSFNLPKQLPVKQLNISLRKNNKKKPGFRQWQEVAAPFVLILFGLSGAIYSSINIFQSPRYNLDSARLDMAQSAAIEPAQTFSLPASEPVSISIDSIGVNAQIIHLAKNPDGTMEVPADHSKVGWYTLSPTPGEIGPAVLVGHVDSPSGPAIFWNLNKLEPGSIITVHRTDGKLAKFSVDSIAQFPQNAFPTEKVYGDINHPGLRVITCGGAFNEQTKRYSHNTVIYASLLMDDSTEVLSLPSLDTNNHWLRQ